MAGHLRDRKDGCWELVVEAGTDELTGKRKQVSRVFRGSRRDAGRALKALEAETTEGDLLGADMPFGALLDRWMKQQKPRLSPGTYRTYEGYIENRIRPALGKVKLRTLNTARLDAFYSALEEDGLAPASIRHVHAIIRRALRQAVRWKLVKVNEALVADLPPVPQVELHPPSPEDVRKLITVAQERWPELGTCLYLKVNIGARRGEMCGLRWPDIDWDGELTIARAIIEVPGGTMEKDTKTHRVRKVSLDTKTLDELRAHRERMEARAAFEELTIDPNGYVFSFCGPMCHPWYPTHLTRMFGKLREEAGVKGRLHDLRHFMATQWLDHGVALPTVSARLGHANSRTTLAVYAHTLKSTDRAAAQEMADILFPDAQEAPPTPSGAETEGAAGR